MNWQWTSIDSISDISEADFADLQAIEDCFFDESSNKNNQNTTNEQSAKHSSPFLQYTFIKALETSNSVGGDSGWQTKHIVIKDDSDKLLAFLPAYIKTHSYGEYVFDHSWAHAYQQHGLAYYPKLVIGIPFTPVTGPRILLQPSVDGDDVIEYIVNQQSSMLEKLDISSLHILFPSKTTSDKYAKHRFFQRQSVQFNWLNRDYASFDEFLESLTARRRRSIKKERKGIAKQNVSVKRLSGNAIDEPDMLFFYECYKQTYLKRSGHTGYLTFDFFMSLLSEMPSKLMLVIATQHEQASLQEMDGSETENDSQELSPATCENQPPRNMPIASALFLFDENGLYGRYWGALKDVSGLHFEACYYQGIEFCIERNIRLFNPGTQGEHKILRGFEPSLCYSNHKMRESAFDDAVRDFLERETPHIKEYQQQSATLLPFKEKDNNR
jgi:predicted N-acyltransferase